MIVREASPEALLLELEAGRIDFIVGRLTAPSAEGTVHRKLYDESVELASPFRLGVAVVEAETRKCLPDLGR